jgi:hypothetical protein
MTVAKEIIIADISKRLIVSLLKAYPSRLAQRGFVWKMMIISVTGSSCKL